MNDHEWFELRRQSDELVYLFRRQVRDGRPAYQRQDQDYWKTYRPGLGWVAWDEASQTCMGRPWDVPPDEQDEDHPPEGVWVSRKGHKSYVYELVYVSGPSVSTAPR